MVEAIPGYVEEMEPTLRFVSANMLVRLCRFFKSQWLVGRICKTRA